MRRQPVGSVVSQVQDVRGAGTAAPDPDVKRVHVRRGGQRVRRQSARVAGDRIDQTQPQAHCDGAHADVARHLETAHKAVAGATARRAHLETQIREATAALDALCGLAPDLDAAARAAKARVEELTADVTRASEAVARLQEKAA